MANDQKHLLVIARLIAGALIGGGDAAAGQAIAGYVEVPKRGCSICSGEPFAHR